MKIYRYEKADGGGPWFTLDGVGRFNEDVFMKDDVLYGCGSREELDKYFAEPAHRVDLSDCRLLCYIVPEEECRILRSGEIEFPKKYKSSYYEVK